MKTTPKKSKFYTVGVRHADDPTRIWTYLITRGKHVKLGDEIVVDNVRGTGIGFIVRIDSTHQDLAPDITYRYITRKVTPL